MKEHCLVVEAAILSNSVTAIQLKLFAQNWHVQPYLVPTTMTGYKIPLSYPPPHTVDFAPFIPDDLVSQVVDKELTKPLSHQIICPADPQISGFYSHVFTAVPKKNRKKRLIISLQKFEPVHPSLSLQNGRNTVVLLQNARLQQNWMMKVHLKYVYTTILIHPESQGLLQFWLNQDSSFSDRMAASPMTQHSST